MHICKFEMKKWTLFQLQVILPNVPLLTATVSLSACISSISEAQEVPGGSADARKQWHLLCSTHSHNCYLFFNTQKDTLDICCFEIFRALHAHDCRHFSIVSRVTLTENQPAKFHQPQYGFDCTLVICLLPVPTLKKHSVSLYATSKFKFQRDIWWWKVFFDMRFIQTINYLCAVSFMQWKDSQREQLAWKSAVNQKVSQITQILSWKLNVYFTCFYIQ